MIKIESLRQNWQQAILPETATFNEVIQNLESVGLKIVLIVKNDGTLVGTITDGDVRRGLINGLNMSSPITPIVHRNAVVTYKFCPREEILRLMNVNKIQQIPEVDSLNRVIGLHLWDELNLVPQRENTMIIMAGGKGTRLRPQTEACPKPMLVVGGKPILLHILERAKAQGFKNFLFSIYYLGEIIEDFFGDGTKFGVSINYLREEFPMGTAGALSLINPIPTSTILVTNGDVLTGINYGELLDFHSAQNATATMAIRSHEQRSSFGVVQTNGFEIIGYEEKPVYTSYVNAGIYALEPEAISKITKKEAVDMPNVFQVLKENKKKILAYPVHELWMDIGNPKDFDSAASHLIDKSGIDNK